MLLLSIAMKEEAQRKGGKMFARGFMKIFLLAQKLLRAKHTHTHIYIYMRACVCVCVWTLFWTRGIRFTLSQPASRLSSIILSFHLSSPVSGCFFITDFQYNNYTSRACYMCCQSLFLRFHHHHHYPWPNSSFRAIALLRRSCQIASDFHFFGFCNNNFLHSKFFSLASNPPTWRNRSLYLCPPATGWPSYTPRHRVPFSSPFTTRRVTVEVF
jgi:hypothetical protein